jgi:hypothetical protein
MSADYRRCAELIRAADGLLITAGAGIGVDSGPARFSRPAGFLGRLPGARSRPHRLRADRQPGRLRGAATSRLGFLRPSPESLPAHRPARRLRDPAPRSVKACRRALSCSPATSMGSSRKPVSPPSGSSSATARSITCSASTAATTASGPPTTSSRTGRGAVPADAASFRAARAAGRSPARTS